MSYTALSPIAFGPALILYWLELFRSFIKHRRNYSEKRDYLGKMIEKYGDNKIKLGDHVLTVAKINFGIIVNMLMIPAFFYGFLVALCLRFDGMIDTSLFILLIPLWIILLPLFIFIILNGIATKNSRANKCEKVSLSLMLPSNALSV